jgi:hypothetical protein
VCGAPKHADVHTEAGYDVIEMTPALLDVIDHRSRHGSPPCHRLDTKRSTVGIQLCNVHRQIIEHVRGGRLTIVN